MTTFAIGFIFISLFTVFIGVAAIVFISFDADTNSQATFEQPTSLASQIRRLNTNTIETVDNAGVTHIWTRSDNIN